LHTFINFSNAIKSKSGLPTQSSTAAVQQQTASTSKTAGPSNLGGAHIKSQYISDGPFPAKSPLYAIESNSSSFLTSRARSETPQTSLTRRARSAEANLQLVSLSSPKSSSAVVQRQTAPCEAKTAGPSICLGGSTYANHKANTQTNLIRRARSAPAAAVQQSASTTKTADPSDDRGGAHTKSQYITDSPAPANSSSALTNLTSRARSETPQTSLTRRARSAEANLQLGSLFNDDDGPKSSSAVVQRQTAHCEAKTAGPSICLGGSTYANHNADTQTNLIRRERSAEANQPNGQSETHSQDDLEALLGELMKEEGILGSPSSSSDDEQTAREKMPELSGGGPGRWMKGSILANFYMQRRHVQQPPQQEAISISSSSDDLECHDIASSISSNFFSINSDYLEASDNDTDLWTWPPPVGTSWGEQWIRGRLTNVQFPPIQSSIKSSNTPVLPLDDELSKALAMALDFSVNEEQVFLREKSFVHLLALAADQQHTAEGKPAGPSSSLGGSPTEMYQNTRREHY
jgi:hypothetical protein